MYDKIQILADKVQQETRETLAKRGLDCQTNIDNATTSIKEGKKYTKIDIGGSGKLMIDQEGNIYGIKAYGVIHKGHYFGTLDTINEYYWGNYKPVKKEVICV